MSFLKRLFTLGRDETYNSAMQYYNNCQYSKAVEYFDKVIQEKSGKSRLYGELAMFYKSQAFRNSGIVHMHEGRFDEAIVDFKMALDILPDSTILLTYLGICYNNVGRFNNAVFEFQKVVQDREDDVQARIRLTIALRNQGLCDRAADELRSAIGIKPDHADLRYFLGLILCSEDKYDAAIEAFTIALEKNPNYLDALSKLGFSYIMKGDLKKAAEALGRAIKFSPHSEPLLSALKMLEDGKDSAVLKILAREELLKSITISFSLIPFASADISKEDLGLYNTLTYIYKQMLEAHPNYADIRFKLAQVYENGQRTEDAVKEYREALRINPDFIQARINMGFLYKALGRMQEAAGEFSYVVDKKGFPVAAIAFELGIVYKKLNRIPDASAAFRRALEIDRHFKEAQKELDSLSYQK